MPTKPQRQNYPSNPVYQDMIIAYQEIDRLLVKVRAIEEKLGLQPTLNRSQGISRALNIPAASDPNAQAQVYGAGFSTPVTDITLSSSISGLSVGSSPNYTLTINAGTFRTTIGIDPIATKKSNLSATAAPGVGDDSGDGYAIGSIWVDVTADNVYMAADVSVGAAVWKLLS